MSGHGGMRLGAGRPPAVAEVDRLRIGAAAENRLNARQEELQSERWAGKQERLGLADVGAHDGGRDGSELLRFRRAVMHRATELAKGNDESDEDPDVDDAATDLRARSDRVATLAKRTFRVPL